MIATTKKPKLRWKKEPPVTGLASIGSGPRGSEFHDGEKLYAVVSAIGGGWRGGVKGWYFVAGWDGDMPLKNTWSRPVATEAEAKLDAETYVRSHLS